MKYNSSIMVFPFGRADSLAKRSVYVGFMALLLIAALGFYWRYLHNLSHVSVPVARQIVAAARPVPKPMVDTAPVAPVVSVVENPVVQAPPVPAPVVELPVPKVESAPEPAKPVVSAQPAVAPASKNVMTKQPPAAVAARRVAVSQPPRQLTESDRLLQAGKQAFASLLGAAYLNPDAYGFKAEDTLREARLGEPLQVYQIAETDRARYQSGQPVKPLLKPTDRWMFPVLIGDQVRCMVRVTRSAHNFVPGEGSKMMGMAWNKVLAKWPAAKGFHPQLLINPEIPCVYFTVPELADQNITDMNQMIFSNGDLSPAAVILACWR